MESQLIPMPDLRAAGIPYSKAQIWRKVKDGTFPKPVRLGPNRVAWVAAEIKAWIAARIAERDAEGGKEAA